MFLKLYVLIALGVLLQQNGCAKAQIRKNVVCYHGTWATYRQSSGKFDVNTIDPFLCTHLMYAFFGIEESGDLRVIDPYLDLEDNGGRGNIRKFNALKLQNPTLKTLAAIGGWNEGSANFSIVANDPERRKRFVRSVVQFVQRHSFDGVDLDWEYPNQRHNLDYDDKTNFITLLRELKAGLDPYEYLLTGAVGSSAESASKSYNITEISKYLDLINVMAYDLHGPWDPVTGNNAPLFAGPNDITEKNKQLNLDAIIKYWLSEGAPREKLVVGVPFYGRSFTLSDAEQHSVGAPHLGRGLAGQYSIEPGTIGYNELCELMQTQPWKEEWDEAQMTPYAYMGQQWVGFENPRSIFLKAQYVRDNDLAGVMVWSLESDDFRGTCGGEKYPLLQTINRVLFDGHTATGLTQAVLNSVAETIQRPAAAGVVASSAVGGQQQQQQQSIVPDPRGNSECGSDVEGYLRDTHDCGKFYYCQRGVSYTFNCPQGLQFDLTTGNCNYAQLVQCERI
ncbi:PREDICTED: chitinase-3-like protein 1 [Bactrocera latifrons]|uniref:chitinase-3-like protein 1 n=1 Tax=Bactrocera latifrons TaxID=174628 RepID=UPI0008DD4D58|nr:PREDICTED: chitinase-3-like protein 1 [Bactrocera latifrons]